MTNVITINAYETYTPSPRPGTKSIEFQAQVTVPSVSSEEAPVVSGHEDDLRAVRVHEGRSYARYLPMGDPTTSFILPTETPAGGLAFLREVETSFEVPLSLRGVGPDEYGAAVQAYYDRFLVVDGVVWVEGTSPLFEPFWVQSAAPVGRVA